MENNFLGAEKEYNTKAKTAMQNIEPEKAIVYFNKAENLFGCAYVKFLTGELDEAKIILTLIKGSSPAANWLFNIINIILDDDTNIIPTYFQIRNYYEQDLEMLFKYHQTEIIEKIIKKITYLEKFNREIYKYTARVLLNNNQTDAAKKFIELSLNISYNDPETHYIYGMIYEKKNEIEKAKAEYKKTLEVSAGYKPAEIKLRDL